MDLFKKYGEVKRVFNLIDKRGMAFITYYDIRDAQEAKRDLQGYDFEGRPLDIHYSIPRDDDDQAKNEENNVSTVFARLRGGTGPLRDKPPMTNREVKRLFEEWGSVKEVRECRGKPFQKFVEFYDIRHSEKCLKEAAETHKSTILDVQPAHAKREGRRDDDRDRDRPRPTGWGGGGGYNGGGGYDDRSRRPGDDYRFAGGRTGGPAPYSGSVSPYGGYGAATPSASTLPAYAHTSSSSSSYITPQPSHQPYSNPSTAALPAGLAHQDASQVVAGGDVGATLQTLLSLVQLFNQPQPQPASPAPAQGYAPPQHAPQAAQASYHLQSLASPYSQQQQQPPPGAASYYQPQPTGAPAALAQSYSTSSSSAAPQQYQQQQQQYQQQQQQQQRYGM